MWILLIIASIGYKPVNISQILLSEIKPQTEHIYLSDNDIVSTIQHSANRSWMLTEPLGGYIGGGLGAGVGIGLALLYYVICDMDAIIYANPDVYYYGEKVMRASYTIGSGIGIWLTGKYIEKEEGSIWVAIAGSVIGFYLSWQIIYPEDPMALQAIAIGPLCGVISYRLSIKNK